MRKTTDSPMPKAGEKTGKKRGEGKRFLKGNPGGTGRPKIPEDIKEALKSYAADAIRFLYASMNDPKYGRNERITCARDLANRGFGLPHIDATVEGAGPYIIVVNDPVEGI